jgi:hypothetical protein
VREFAAGTQLELQRQLKSWEARAVMAEEQLAHLQVGGWVCRRQVCADLQPTDVSCITANRCTVMWLAVVMKSKGIFWGGGLLF